MGYLKIAIPVSVSSMNNQWQNNLCKPFDLTLIETNSPLWCYLVFLSKETIKLLLKMFITSGLITLSRGDSRVPLQCNLLHANSFFVLEFHK